MSGGKRVRRMGVRGVRGVTDVTISIRPLIKTMVFISFIVVSNIYILMVALNCT